MRLGFTVHWNGPPVYTRGTEHRRCEAYWRAARNYHVHTKGWSDIAYSFGVCVHGERFEGRGWDRLQWANGEDQVGQNDGPDRDWYTVCSFLGIGEHPSAEMVQGIHALVAEGRDTGRCGMRVLPHNAFKVKPCPGPELDAWAAYWDNRPMSPAVPVKPTPAPETGDDDLSVLIPSWAELDQFGRPWAYQLLTKGRTPVVRSYNWAPLNVDHGWLHRWVDINNGVADAVLDLDDTETTVDTLNADALGMGEHKDSGRVGVVCADGAFIDVAKAPI